MVRRALESDITEVNQLGKMIHPKFEKLFLMNEILTESFSRVYIYEEDHKIVGFIHVTVLYETMDIVNIAVDSSYQNKGIGSCLLDYVISDVGEEIQLITLEVNVNNEKAIRLYKKFGFDIINERKNYYDGKENAYLMGRRLGE